MVIVVSKKKKKMFARVFEGRFVLASVYSAEQWPAIKQTKMWP